MAGKKSRKTRQRLRTLKQTLKEQGKLFSAAVSRPSISSNFKEGRHITIGGKSTTKEGISIPKVTVACDKSLNTSNSRVRKRGFTLKRKSIDIVDITSDADQSVVYVGTSFLNKSPRVSSTGRHLKKGLNSSLNFSNCELEKSLIYVGTLPSASISSKDCESSTEKLQETEAPSSSQKEVAADLDENIDEDVEKKESFMTEINSREESKTAANEHTNDSRTSQNQSGHDPNTDTEEEGVTNNEKEKADEVIVLNDSQELLDSDSDVIVVEEKLDSSAERSKRQKLNSSATVIDNTKIKLPSFETNSYIPLVMPQRQVTSASAAISRLKAKQNFVTQAINTPSTSRFNFSQGINLQTAAQRSNISSGLTVTVFNKNLGGQRTIGTNFYNPVSVVQKQGLREICIDGSNVAMLHSQGKFFSVEGLKICIDYFLQRGHKVKAFVPQFRCKAKECSNPGLLEELYKKNLVVYTPSREVLGRRICSYDDRYIVQSAAILNGIVVSCDNFKDLLRENPNLRDTIENRLLMPTFVGDIIIFPDDPLGRNGPNLDTFLKFP